MRRVRLSYSETLPKCINESSLLEAEKNQGEEGIILMLHGGPAPS